MTFSSFLVLRRNYKMYKTVFYQLKNRSFYRSGDLIYSHKFGDPDDGFVWFLEGNEFKLKRNVYLHNTFYTFFDPYSLFWLLKYRKWVKKNIHVDNLPNWFRI